MICFEKQLIRETSTRKTVKFAARYSLHGEGGEYLTIHFPDLDFFSLYPLSGVGIRILNIENILWRL